MCKPPISLLLSMINPMHIDVLLTEKLKLIVTVKESDHRLSAPDVSLAFNFML